MAKVGTALQISRIKTLNFEFTKTLRNQSVDLNSIGADFVINVDGTIYSNRSPSESASVVLVGGLSTFINEKISREPFTYITVQQQRTLYLIITKLGKVFKNATLTSSNQSLKNYLDEMYYNNKF
jgi:hypothetical protein